MTTVEITKKLRTLCEESLHRLPRPDKDALGVSSPETGRVGPLSYLVGEELKTLLISDQFTGFDTHDLRREGVHFALGQAIRESDREWDAVVDAILFYLPARTQLPLLDAPIWSRAIDLARGLVADGVYRPPNQRVTAVADAGKRLKAQGYALTVGDGAYRFAEGDLERAAEKIKAAFGRLGQVNVLAQLFRILREGNRYGFGMYLPVREYDYNRSVASYPFGFLVNLAVRAPALGSGSADVRAEWRAALNLARDIVSALNVEPYSQYETINSKPDDLESLLREIALFDHLFTLPQQWPKGLAPLVLTEFFPSEHQKIMRDELGWSLSDAVKLYSAVADFSTPDPKVFSRNAFVARGVDKALLDNMLPCFAHATDTANANYDSPLAAQSADLMFKPLLQIESDKYLLPTASLAGPAFYEATMAALRPLLRKAQLPDPQGDGTERVVGTLLRDAGLNVTAAGASYNLGPNEEGECDFVIENDKRILLVECKAKPLTRDAMAGVQGDALLDFAGGMFAAQAQALRHERILRTRGRIDFCDGTPSLVWRQREITRLSVTLLNHGALQDRAILWSLYEALIQAKAEAPSGYDKMSQIREFDKNLTAVHNEAEALKDLGIPTRVQPLASASLSVGSLSVLLKGVSDLDHFIKRVTVPATFMTYNPVFEFYHQKKSGLVR